MPTWICVVELVAGVAALAWSADVFVDGAARLARRRGLSPLLVGMVIVGFGTSLPELTVSLLSAIEGNPSLALGNAYGSNIANIGLILGLTAAICPVAVSPNVLRRELPALLLATLVCGGLLLNGAAISRLDAATMLALFAVFLAGDILAGKRGDFSAAAAEGASPAVWPRWPPAFKIAFGLATVIASSQMLVKGAVRIAEALGVPDLVIGLSVVAVGTSLPELASSLAAIRKREHDLALGNIVGSNFFNTLAVVGFAGIARPMDIAAAGPPVRMVMVRDYPVMIAMTFLLTLFCIPLRRGGVAVVTRVEGALLLFVYVAYLFVLAKGAGTP